MKILCGIHTSLEILCWILREILRTLPKYCVTHYVGFYCGFPYAIKILRGILRVIPCWVSVRYQNTVWDTAWDSGGYPYVTKTLRGKLRGILRGILCGNSCTFHKCCVGYCVEYCVGLKYCVGIAVRFSNTAWNTARASTPTPHNVIGVNQRGSTRHPASNKQLAGASCPGPRHCPCVKKGAKCFVHSTNPAFDHVHYRYLKFPWTWGGRADGRAAHLASK